MRKSLLLLSFLAFFTPLIKAQNAGFLPGYIITNANDTIPGLVKYINQVPYRVLIDIKFKKDENSKVEKYAPAMLKGYKAGNKYYESFLHPNSETNRYFMEVLVNGSIRAFRLEFTTGPGSFVSYVYLLKGGDTVLFNPSDGPFKAVMSTYVLDYKELALKINNGEYKKKDLGRIVMEYNDWKTQQSN